MSEGKVRVIIKRPDEEFGHVTNISPSLKNLQRTVGGYIETVTLAQFHDGKTIHIICNEEGKMMGLDLNRGVYDDNKQLIDIIAGTAFICDCSGENFGSLTEEQIKKYLFFVSVFWFSFECI